MESLHQLEIVILLFVAVLALTTVANKILIPYPILLVIGGLILGVLPSLPTDTLSPDLVFLVFLPPILWAAAYITSLREFRQNLRPISLLAVGLVLVTTAAVVHTVLPGIGELKDSRYLFICSAYHCQVSAKLPNAHLHAAIHVIVENQLAQEVDLTKDALARLCAAGLDRHEAIHAIGSVLMKHVWDLLRGDAKPPDPNAPYFQALQGLTASRWREEFGTTRKRIPYGTKLPVALTVRERDLIRDETFCDPNFAKCVVVEGAGIRVELSLDEIEDIQGYVAAEANHTKNATRRKELDRLFDELQVFLDTYDDQSE